MANPFYLLYFIHDDIGDEFNLNTLPNILEAVRTKYTNIILIHNKRFVRVDNKGKEFVFYQTSVSTVVKNAEGKNDFNRIHITFLWEDGFEFAFRHILKESGEDSLVGLITLSHAAGIVINRNAEKLPIVSSRAKIRHSFRKTKKGRRSKNTTYFFKDSADDKRFLCTKTVTEQVHPVQTNGFSANVFEAKYTRNLNTSFCKHYEGLFIFQLTSFFKKNKMKFRFIIFSNCYIQLFDNAFLFRPITGFTLGAESESDRVFWDFPTIINAIEANSDKPTDILTGQIFQDCKNKFAIVSTDITYRYFLCKLDKFTDLNTHFEKMIGVILSQLKNDNQFKLSIQKWLEKATTVTQTNTPFFDTLQFFQFSSSVSKIKFDNDVQSYSSLLENEIVIQRNVEDSAFCGYAIYLPRTLDEFNTLKGPLCNYFNSPDKNDFVLASQYDELLIELFRPTEVARPNP
jgi:hypothetical protein